MWTTFVTRVARIVTSSAGPRAHRRDYDGAERLLMRQAASARERLSVYLALARLAGRSFNALYPTEREAIEALLRRARTSNLARVLLAILEIDYYQLHGLVSAAPVRPAEVRVAALDATSRSLVSHLDISRRARRELAEALREHERVLVRG